MTTAEQVDRMERMRDLGMSLSAIAQTFGLNSKQHVGRLLRGEIGLRAPSMRRNKKVAPERKPYVPEPKSPVEHYNAMEMKRRKLPLSYIAAKTRLSYREIEAL